MEIQISLMQTQGSFYYTKLLPWFSVLKTQNVDELAYGGGAWGQVSTSLNSIKPQQLLMNCSYLVSEIETVINSLFSKNI